MTAKACDRCGKVHKGCTAHNRAGKPCGNRPLPDMEVCRLHGGASPAAKVAAKTRQLERDAEAVLRRQRWADGDETPILDPLTELAQLAGEAIAFKDFLRAQVHELDGAITQEWSDKAVKMMTADGLREYAVVKEDLRAVVTAYERAQARCAKILADIVKLDLAGRLLELNTARAAGIASAVREGLARVDMPAELRAGAQAAIAEALAGMSQTRTPAPKELTA